MSIAPQLSTYISLSSLLYVLILYNKKNLLQYIGCFLGILFILLYIILINPTTIILLFPFTLDIVCVPIALLLDLSTTLAAGHLQNAGYQLLWKIDNKFLYYFNDNDMYQICSWEENYCQNPMFNEIVRSASLMQSKSSQLKEGV